MAPTEIEDILQKHEAVQESLVFGKKEPSVQELISAVVIIKPDKKVRILKSKQIHMPPMVAHNGVIERELQRKPLVYTL